MKTRTENHPERLPHRILSALAVLVTGTVAVDSAVNASHIMVFFSLIVLSALFFTLYEESAEHILGVSIACLVLGFIYILASRPGFTWWRLVAYSGLFFAASLLLLTIWLRLKRGHHGGDLRNGDAHPAS